MNMMRILPPPQTADREEDREEDRTVYDARDLIPGGTKADIVLDGQTYTLRITRAGKLILTK